MRISEDEATIIRDSIRRRFSSVSRIMLFGSRVDDSKRGGDIDILVESDEPLDAGVRHKLEALSDMHIRLGDRKIDFVLASPPGSAGDAQDGRRIVQIARETGIPL